MAASTLLLVLRCGPAESRSVPELIEFLARPDTDDNSAVDFPPLLYCILCEDINTSLRTDALSILVEMVKSKAVFAEFSLAQCVRYKDDDQPRTVSFLYCLCETLDRRPVATTPQHRREILRFRLGIVELLSTLIAHYQFAALLVILRIDKDHKVADALTADAQTPATRKHQLARASTSSVASSTSNSSFFSDLPLYAGVSSSILSHVLDLWLEAIRMLDYAPAAAAKDIRALTEEERLMLGICVTCASIFAQVSSLGGDSFRQYMANETLDQEMNAILLRYHLNTIHALLRQQSAADVNAMLSVFFDETV